VVCAAVTAERLEALRLPLMVADNTESHRTAFTITVDYKHGTSTGISAADRAATLRALADPGAGPAAFVRPGTCSRCGHGPAACSSAAGTPRRPSIWRAWPAFSRAACCARS
jgi:hypothetical protein